MADSGLRKDELTLISRTAQGLLGAKNPTKEVREAVLLYFSIRETGEDQDSARPIFKNELKGLFDRKDEAGIAEIYDASLETGEKLWNDAFVERLY